MVMPLVGSEHGVTQLPTPLSLTWPAGQFGGGHMPNSALEDRLATSLVVPSQMQTGTPFTNLPEGSGCVVGGQLQEKMAHPAQPSQPSMVCSGGSGVHVGFIGFGQTQ